MINEPVRTVGIGTYGLAWFIVRFLQVVIIVALFPIVVVALLIFLIVKMLQKKKVTNALAEQPFKVAQVSDRR